MRPFSVDEMIAIRDRKAGGHSNRAIGQHLDRDPEHINQALDAMIGRDADDAARALNERNAPCQAA